MKRTTLSTRTKAAVRALTGNLSRPEKAKVSQRLQVQALEDRSVPATLADHLVAINGSTTFAQGFGTQIANSSALTSFNLPVISDSLSNVVAGALTTQFQSVFSAVKTAIDDNPANPNAQLAAIDAIGPTPGTMTVVTNTAGELSFRFQTTLANAVAVAAAQNIDDFGFGLGKYLEAANLSALTDGSLDFNTTVAITFGSVDQSGAANFFLGGGPVLDNAGIRQSVSLGNGSTVELIGSDLAIDIAGSAGFNVDFDLNVGTAGAKITGTALNNLGSQVSPDVNGAVTVGANLTARLLGVPFVKWDPTITFTLTDSGFTTPTIGNGIDIDNARFVNKRDLVNALLGVNGGSGLLANNLFGLDGLKLGNFDLATVVQIAQDIQPVLSALSTLYGQGFSLDSFTNLVTAANGLTGTADTTSDGVDDTDPNETDGSGFDFDPNALLSFVSGNTDVTLLTYQDAGPGPGFNNPAKFNLYTYSIYGVYFITLSAELTAGLSTEYSYKVGLNGKQGVFVDEANTFFKGSLGASVQLNIDGKLFNLDELTTDSGRAGLAGTASMTLKLDDPNDDGRIFLSELGQNLDPSDPLGALGDFLKDRVYFEKSAQGAFVANYQHNTAESLFVDLFIPEELRGPVSDFIQDSGLGDVIQGVDKLVGDIAAGAVDVVSGWFGGGDSDEAEDAARALASGDVIAILDGIARRLRPGIPEHSGNEDPPSSVLELFTERDTFDGIYHRNGVVSDVDKAAYTYIYDLDTSVKRINYSDLQSGDPTGGTDEPEDHIRYTLSDDGKTLTVEPNLTYAGAEEFANTVRLADIGGAQVQLIRETTLPDGTVADDPIQNFNIVDGFKVVVNTLGGDDTVQVDNSLTFRVEVDAGAGDDYVDAGGGDDSVFGADGEDTVYGGPGADDIDVGNDTARNYAYGESGGDTILGGPGVDRLEGGSGEDELSGFGSDDRINGGSDDDTIIGGTGNDSLLGGSDDDTITGGTGNDTVVGGTGDDTLDGGADNDFFYWKFGHGADVAHGAGGDDVFQFDGNASGTAVEYSASGTIVGFLPLSNPSDGLTVFDGIEGFVFIAKSGPDSVVIGDLSGTDVVLPLVNAGADDGEIDRVTYTGTSVADAVGIGYSDPDPLFGIPRVVSINPNATQLGLVSNYENANDRITYKAGGGADTVTVDNWQGTLTVDGQEGGDTATVNHIGSGSGIANVADTGSGGTDQLIVNGTGNPDDYQIDAAEVALRRPGESEKATYDGSVERAELNTGGGADVVSVVGTSAATDTFVNTQAEDDFVGVSGLNQTLDPILGRLTVDAGSGGTNRLIVSDFGGSPNPNVVLTASTITGFAGPTNAVDIRYSATGGNFTNGSTNDGILLRGSASDAAGDVFTINSSLAGSTTKLEGNGGDDTFIFAAQATLAGTIDAGFGTDTINMAALTSQQVNLAQDLGALDGFNTIPNPTATGGLFNINRVIASAAGTTDRLTGRNEDANWMVKVGVDQNLYTDVGSGRRLFFANFEELFGGSAKDDFTVDFSAGDPLPLPRTLGLLINGQDGVDALTGIGTDKTDRFRLAIKQLFVNGGRIRYLNLENLTARGGKGNDIFGSHTALLAPVVNVRFFGEDGNDWAGITANTRAQFLVDGGSGTDKLSVIRNGARYVLPLPRKVDPSGIFLFTNRRPITFASIEIKDIGLVQNQTY